MARKSKVIFSAATIGGTIICSVICHIVHYDYVTEYRLASLAVFAVLFVIVMIKAVKAKVKISDYAAPLTFIITGIVAMCVMAAVPLVETRSQIQFLIFFTYGAARIITDFVDELAEVISVSRFKWIVPAALTACAVASLISTAAVSNESYKQFVAREKYIAEQKSAGIYDIELRVYNIPEDPHVGMFNIYNSDPDYWITKATCWYYEIDSIYYYY